MKKFFSVKEVAELLGVSRSLIYEEAFQFFTGKRTSRRQVLLMPEDIQSLKEYREWQKITPMN